MELAGNSVCVVGSVTMDLVVRAPRLPKPGETVLGGAYRTFPGGKGANQAVAAARMGVPTTLVAAIGDDPHGVKVKAALEVESIQLERLLVRAGEATGLGLITVDDDGENQIVVSPGANATLTADDVRASEALIQSAHVLLLQLESPNATVLEAARLARAAGKSVILNAAPGRIVSQELMKLVDVLVVNRPEAATLLQMDSSIDPARLALRLPELGPATSLLTLGSQGAILAHRGRPRRVPTPSVKAVDAVGAGDAFCGALASAWAPVHACERKGGPDELRCVERAVLLASAAGAMAATRAGAMPSMPRRSEIEPLAASMKIEGW